jgi:threonine synthase
MTTVQNANVHALAVEGTFDDCQRIVKDMFSDLPFKKKLNLGAVNSINWARVMAQTVYYIQAACSLGSPSKAVSFSVPTGNFGDILAGYIAKKMGVPINQLIIATNENDILTRTFETGRYEIDAVKKTHSPSMDIQISSNFERLLFDLYNRDGNQIRLLMEQLKQSQGFMIEENLLNQAKGLFAAARVSNDETLEIIKNVYEQTGMLLDPHTAVGYGAAQKVKSSRQVPMVHLACAHAAKFPDIVEKATGIKPPLPHFMADLFDREEHIITLPNNLDAIKSFIEQKS